MIPECSFPAADPLVVEQTVVLNVEAVQNASFAAGVAQMLFVAFASHPAIQSGQNVDAPGA